MRHLDDGSLQAWLDRSRSGMDEAERADIERHLAECGECSERLAELDAMTPRIGSLLAAAESAAGDVPEWAAVVARARGRRDGGKRRPVWTAATWAAGIAAVMGLGWLSNDLYRGRSVGTARQGTAPAARESAQAPPSVAEAPVDSENTETLADASAGTGNPAETLADASAGTGNPAERVADALPAVARPAVPILMPTNPEPGTPAPTTFEEEAPGNPARKPDLARVAAVPGPPVLRGRVTDESGRPLSAAQVFVPGTGVGALTDEDGRFSLSLPDTAAAPEGRDVTLTAQLLGYGDASRELKARAGDTVSADLRMVERAVALDEIVVTGATVAAERAADAGRRELGNTVADSTWGGPWTTVDRADAERRVGFPLLLVADLRLIAIQVGTVQGAPVVRVVQELDGGAQLTLFETGGVGVFREETPRDAASGSTAWTRRGDVRIWGTAPIPADALGALLRRLR